MRTFQFGNFWGGVWLKDYPVAYLHTPWFHFLIGRWEDRLYSERHGLCWCKKVFGLRITIRNLTRQTRKEVR